ncbi:division/cell wall cluster transcriptional repressor MraZ [Thiohalobacter sp.]|uniref:division/cell wall cluster transcriptional repressor MraZ n=1 Tax=Thiohalobacter sp. TaxID=2025948 RepID=UPI0026311DE9|nr:division/cell wall cluster transcriptional repressor MraZ [Thiohalobacter sp.]
MFLGGNTVNLDAKGRLALPTRFRGPLQEACEGQLVLTVHYDGCLLLYPRPEWEEIERTLVRLPNQKRHTRLLQRMLLGHATEVEMDGNGRILIPPRLREFAGLEKRVVLVALSKKFEIWNAEAWDRSQQEYVSSDLDAGELPPELDSLSL